MPDFRYRSREPELMDDLNAPADEVNKNLDELEIVNKYLGGYAPLHRALNKLVDKNGCSILDVGSGGGDVLRNIGRWLRRNRREATLTGVDINPNMTRYAIAHTPGSEAQFITSDIFDPSLDAHPHDVVMSSLFCHHFDDESLVRLLRRMHALSRRAVIVNDLHRHWVAYYSIKWITRFFSNSKMVKNDACVSVARGMTRSEWERVLHAAGITDYTIEWRWAFRWLIVIPTRHASVVPDQKAVA